MLRAEPPRSLLLRRRGRPAVRRRERIPFVLPHARDDRESAHAAGRDDRGLALGEIRRTGEGLERIAVARDREVRAGRRAAREQRAKVEIAVGASRMAAVDETDAAIGGDDHVAQRQVAMRDDDILRRRSRGEACEQLLRHDMAVARVELAGIDLVLLDGSDWRYLAYHLGGEQVSHVVKEGKVVWER